MEEYADRSLADIRSLKTHGEKRVNAILEVFCTVHEALATATLQENIDVVIVPRFVPPLTRWLMETVAQPDLPPVDELHKHIVKPMVNQIKIDLGDQVAGLAAARLCLDENSPSVKQQAETIGVTRARVYQLLEDCAKVMDVRWPEGRWLFAPLATRFGTSDPETIGLVHGIVDLFYPAGTTGQRRPTKSTKKSQCSTSGAAVHDCRSNVRSQFELRTAIVDDHPSTIAPIPASMYCPPSFGGNARRACCWPVASAACCALRIEQHQLVVAACGLGSDFDQRAVEIDLGILVVMDDRA